MKLEQSFMRPEITGQAEIARFVVEFSLSRDSGKLENLEAQIEHLMQVNEVILRHLTPEVFISVCRALGHAVNP